MLRFLLFAFLSLALSTPASAQQTKLQDGPNQLAAATDLSLTFLVSGGKYYRLGKGSDGKPVFVPVSLIFINLDGVVPDPVDPDPPPIPPEPPVPVADNPFPLPGLRMLIIEETGDRLTVDPGQRDILLSSDVQEYMRTHAARVGNALEWRKLDDDFTDQQLTEANISKLWRDAYARAKRDAKYNPATQTGDSPWYLLSDGVKYESKQLPKGPTALPDFLELLKKYGGN